MTSGKDDVIDPDRTAAAVKAMYRNDPEREWHRMARHRMEFAISLRALKDHLPAPPAAILDCGGGPGRYAITLTQQGYDVTLFDLSPELLQLAKDRSVEAGVTLDGLEEGTATDLSRFADASFDAVLLMGPLYHLLDRADRERALTEARRVVRPGGPVFAAFISRYAGHIDAVADYPAEALEQLEAFNRIETTGLQPPREDGQVAFVAYFAHPSEIRPLCRHAGLEIRTVLGVEGVCSLREEKINALQGEAWDQWVEINYRIAHDPCTHGGVEHLLAVCHRPRWRAILHRVARTLSETNIDYRLVGSAALALHGVDVPVHDLDLEMAKEDAQRLLAQFKAHIVLPLAWREAEHIRSHYGRLEIDGVGIDVMAGLERRVRGHWVPALCTSGTTVELDGTRICLVALEEETLSQMRRGRLDAAAAALPSCDHNRLLERLAEAQSQGWI